MRDTTRFELSTVEETEYGWHFDVRLPENSSWFAGHFPGDPVLPAVAQLDLVARLWRHVGTAPASFVVGVRRVRFLARARPGDRLRVEIERPDADGVARFSIGRDGQRVSEGRLIWDAGVEVLE